MRERGPQYALNGRSFVEGWRWRLRAYMVLGERDQAHTVATDTKWVLTGDKFRRIENMINTLGLES